AVLAASLGQIYMALIPRWWVASVDRLWYPALLRSDAGWLVVDPWAYRLQPYFLSSRVAYCAFVAIAVTLTVRACARERGLVTSLFIAMQLAANLPYLRVAVTNWLGEPASGLWFFSAVWFAVYMFVAVPASVAAGARLAVKAHT